MEVPATSKRAKRILDGPLGLGVLLFGFPMALAMTLHGVFNLVDAWFVGQIPDSADSLAAIAICDPILMLATIFANGISTATVALISRARGEGDERRVRVLSGQSLILVAAVSAIFGIGGAILAWPIGFAMGAKGVVLELTTEYLVVMFLGIFSLIFMLQLTAILRATGDAIGTMIVLIVANALNIALDPFLIDSEAILGIEGLPKYGLMGAAYATIAARIFGCALAWWLCLRASPRLMPMQGEWSFDRGIIRQIAKIGTPNTLQLVVRVAAILLLISLVNQAFTAAADQSLTAAVGIGIRIDMVILFGAMGWGAAASTFVGQNLGAGNPERAARSGWWAVGYSIASMIILAWLVREHAATIVGWFAGESLSVIEYGTEYLSWLSPSYPFAAAGVVLALALNGAGSTKPPAVMDAIGLLALAVPGAAISVLVLGYGRESVWLAMAGCNLVLALMYTVWFFRGRWKTVKF